MWILSALLRKEVRWVLRGNEPATFPFPVNDQGWTVVNPLVLHREEFNPRDRTLAFRLVDGNVLVDTSFVDFVVPPETGEGALYPPISDFLKRLRYASGQASIPEVASIAMTPQYMASLPAQEYRQPAPGSTTRIGEYVARTAISEATVEEAASRSSADIPVYATVLLDAIDAVAHDNDDHKKAILFSAIAVDAMASALLAERYAALLHADSGTEHLRIIQYTVRAGESGPKDPVYARLTERDPPLKERLHEIPLYLMRRSLLQDDKSLYDEAHRLQRTRNKLAHTGATTDVTLPLNRQGALMAIDTARRVFEWFGAQGKFYVPYRGGEVP